MIQIHRTDPLTRALQEVEKQEQKLAGAAMRTKPAGWKQELSRRIPEKVYTGLESAFCKGFSMVFDQGKGIIEKSYNKENMKADHAVRDFAVQRKGGRRELKKMDRSARQSDLLNLTMTTAEGLGLGALGVGMPDIVLFLATLLRGVYETALHYGFDYESPQEQLLILKMLETSLSCGRDWIAKNTEVDQMLALETVGVTQEDLTGQLQVTSSAFAMDMLLLKFIQGIPLVGMVGGAANPLYYSRIMKYVQLKYRKRYLWKCKSL